MNAKIGWSATCLLFAVCLGEALELHRLHTLLNIELQKQPTALLVETQAAWLFYCVPGTSCRFARSGHVALPPTEADGCALVHEGISGIAKKVYACQ